MLQSQKNMLINLFLKDKYNIYYIKVLNGNIRLNKIMDFGMLEYKVKIYRENIKKIKIQISKNWI